MVLPTAKDMAGAMLRIGQALQRTGISKSQSVFAGLNTHLKSLPETATKWSYEVSPSNPIEFAPTFNHSVNSEIRPRLSARVSVRGTPAGGVCFDCMDVALDVLDSTGKVLVKHHVDLANYKPSDGNFQHGPLFHLQFGGHTPKQARAFEVPIDEPRWPCFPMDLVLVCEIVVANFYPEQWEKLRAEPQWRNTVIASQQYCLSPFLKRLSERLGDTKRTVLDHLWASTSGPMYRNDGLLP